MAAAASRLRLAAFVYFVTSFSLSHPNMAMSWRSVAPRSARMDARALRGARLSAETGLPYVPAAGGEMVAGTYRQRLTLTSGRFAIIDNGLGFALVP
jgi:hypothetical protein